MAEFRKLNLEELRKNISEKFNIARVEQARPKDNRTLEQKAQKLVEECLKAYR